MTADLGDLVLRGREVVLRPLEAGDAPALAAAASESRDTFDLTTVPNGPAESAAYVDRALRDQAAGRRYPFVVVWRNRIVGTTSYLDVQTWEWPAPLKRRPRTFPDCVEIGSTWLAASAQRTSCNTETKLLLLQHAFEVWEVHSVFLKTDARNQRSRAAIERLGCKLDGIRRAHMPATDGTARDSAYYSIVRDEWPAVRERLLRRLGQISSLES